MAQAYERAEQGREICADHLVRLNAWIAEHVH
jgi:hypothetical protein